MFEFQIPCELVGVVDKEENRKKREKVLMVAEMGARITPSWTTSAPFLPLSAPVGATNAPQRQGAHLGILASWRAWQAP